MRAFAHTAGIAVLYKKILKKGIEFIDKPVMNHSVPKIRSKDFTFYGFVYNKGDATARTVASIFNFIFELK